jgi:hypothetical protein
MQPCLIHAGSSRPLREDFRLAYMYCTVYQKGVAHLHHLQITQHKRSLHPLRPSPTGDCRSTTFVKRTQVRSHQNFSQESVDQLRSTDLRLFSRVCLQDRSQSEISLVTARTSLLFFTVAEACYHASSVTTRICASRASSSSAPIQRPGLVAGCVFTLPYSSYTTGNIQPSSVVAQPAVLPRSAGRRGGHPFHGVCTHACTIRFALARCLLLPCSLAASA